MRFLRKALPRGMTEDAWKSLPSRDSALFFVVDGLLRKALISFIYSSFFSGGRETVCFTVSMSIPKKISSVEGKTVLAAARGIFRLVQRSRID